jgi:hypothetical protein
MRVTDAEGKPYGVYDHAIDVTARVLARRTLEENEVRLEQLTESWDFSRRSGSHLWSV